ncbi:hypothetical protein N9023_02850 [Opitutaceae bacterium]|nr:hypothetical protein [Opitutaceae bacterium]
MTRCDPSLRCLHRVGALVMISLGLFGTGCQSPLTVTVPHIERFQLSNPDASPLEIDRALSERAEIYARTRPYTQVWHGHGLSMEPLLPPEAWIVSETLPFEQLERGQVVLFNRSPGHRVAHALLKKTGQGWITVGVNNERVDHYTRVTRRNYLGVITAAFVADR